MPVFLLVEGVVWGGSFLATLLASNAVKTMVRRGRSILPTPEMVVVGGAILLQGLRKLMKQ